MAPRLLAHPNALLQFVQKRMPLAKALDKLGGRIRSRARPRSRSTRDLVRLDRRKTADRKIDDSFRRRNSSSSGGRDLAEPSFDRVRGRLRGRPARLPVSARPSATCTTTRRSACRRRHAPSVARPAALTAGQPRRLGEVDRRAGRSDLAPARRSSSGRGRTQDRRSIRRACRRSISTPGTMRARRSRATPRTRWRGRPRSPAAQSSSRQSRSDRARPDRLEARTEDATTSRAPPSRISSCRGRGAA